MPEVVERVEVMEMVEVMEWLAVVQWLTSRLTKLTLYLKKRTWS